MARLKNHEFGSINISEINDPVVFVVDMINGFVKEGNLADTAIMSIVEGQRRLMDRLECKNVFICDSHPPKTREFLAYPKHCVIGSKETEVIGELRGYIKKIICKNSTNTFVAPEFQEFLKEDLMRYKDIIIVGCCTDLCILQFALSLQSYLNEHNLCDQRIIVVESLCETYHIDHLHDAYFWNDVSLKNMQTNGITVVSEIEDDENERN